MSATRIPAKLISIFGCLAGLVFMSGSFAAGSAQRVVTCPYLKSGLQFDVPAKFGDMPAIDFDYPAKASQFSLRDGNLLLVAMDESEPSRVRIVISAQLNKTRGTYDGQILVDMGGNQMQLYNGSVHCKVASGAATH